MASDGRSFDTKEEAAAASDCSQCAESAPVEATEPTRNRVKEFFLYSGMLLLFGWLTAASVAMTLNGGWHFKTDWGWLSVPFAVFFLAGLTMTSAAGIYGAASNRDDIRPGAVFDWWVGKLGTGILWGIGGLIALAVAWYFLSGIFEGVGKGTSVIIVLLFMILLALNQIASNSRRG